MNKKRFILLFAILILLAGCTREPEPSDSAETEAEGEAGATPATPLPTKPAPSGTTILADGQLAAVNPQLPLGFSANGRLLDVHVKAGDQVSEGDLIATLDDEAMNESVTSAELGVTQAENSLAQAQLSLDELLEWEPDEIAISLAEANLAAAEAAHENALTQDAASGNSLTAARISVDQATRNLADTQKAYDQAWQEARDWELNIRKPSCLPGQGGPVPCTGQPMHEKLENERDATARALPRAQEGLDVARANYSLALAGLNDDSALNAEAAVVNAQQALHQTQKGPKEAEIAAARLDVVQSELSLEQAEMNLSQTRQALDDARLRAPWGGTVLSVDAAVGSIVGAGAPIITLLDTGNLQFHTSNLSERDLGQIEAGQTAQITLKAYPAETIDGRVVRVLPQASGTVGDAATFTVVIELDQTELELLSGMTGRVEIKR